jgi:hypothetical protein
MMLRAFCNGGHMSYFCLRDTFGINYNTMYFLSCYLWLHKFSLLLDSNSNKISITATLMSVCVCVCILCVFVCACVPFLQRIIWKVLITASVLGLSNVRSCVFTSRRKVTSSIMFRLFQDSKKCYCKSDFLLLSFLFTHPIHDNSAKLER